MRTTRDILRRRWPLLVVPPLLALAAAVAYVALTPTRYEAEAKLLVSPVAGDDELLVGFGVLRESGDGRRVVESAAELVETPEVADKVKLELGLTEPRAEVLEMVSADPIGDSNVVAVVGRASTAEQAAQIANAFAQETVAERTARFQSELLAVTRRLAQRLRATPPAQRSSPGSLQLERRLATLRELVSTRDPTLQQISAAVAPEEPSTPPGSIVVPVALALGLLLGLGLLAGAALARVDETVEAEPELEERLSGLDRRERELAARERRLVERPAEPAPDPEVAKRLERRTEIVTARERELARRAGAVAARERELEDERAALAKRLTELERREAAPAARPARDGRDEDAVAAAAAAGDDAPGAWNLETLSRLVEQRGPEFPHRVDEWTSYLFFLRAHADSAGRLPRSFDWLVEDTFAELVS